MLLLLPPLVLMTPNLVLGTVHLYTKLLNMRMNVVFHRFMKQLKLLHIGCSDDKFKEFEPGLKFEKQLIYCWLTIKIVFNVSRLKLVLN